MENRLMSEREKADVYMKSIQLEEEGQPEQADALRRSIPVPAYLAKIFMDKAGPDFLARCGHNMAEVEAEDGSV